MPRAVESAVGRIAPADWATLFILSVVTATLLVRAPSAPVMGGPLAFHVTILAVYAALAYVMRRYASAGWVPLVRAGAVVAVMFTLYGTLGQLVFDAIPWVGDSALAAVDRVLFLGTSPALWVEPFVTRGTIEVMSFVYGLFIPYLYMSIFLGCIGRPGLERDEFITGFAVLYALSFLGYLLVPARGPIVHHAADYQGMLAGGFFHQLVVTSIDRMGGPHGAFPSLHIGASVYACYFDLRHQRLRGMTYVPVVLLIAAATVVLRYHYVVDLVAGFALALTAATVAAAWSARRPPPTGVDGPDERQP